MALTDADRERKREYNSRRYRQTRAVVKRQVESGQARCWRCGVALHPAEPWHLGHDDYDRTVIHGAEHARCNLGAAARKVNAMRQASRTRRLPTW